MVRLKSGWVVNAPRHAIKASIAMQKELVNYNKVRMTNGERSLRTDIGLNTGDPMLGVIGNEYRYESTVISDALNTASRMEGLTKVFGGSIILSEKTLSSLLDTFPVSSKLKEDNNLQDTRKVSSKRF